MYTVIKIRQSDIDIGGNINHYILCLNEENIGLDRIKKLSELYEFLENDDFEIDVMIIAMKHNILDDQIEFLKNNLDLFKMGDVDGYEEIPIKMFIINNNLKFIKGYEKARQGKIYKFCDWYNKKFNYDDNLSKLSKDIIVCV